MAWAGMAIPVRHSLTLTTNPSQPSNAQRIAHRTRHQAPRLRRSAAAGDEDGGGAADDRGSIAEQAKLLNELFYSRDAAAAADPSEEAPASSTSGPLILHDLPLWRVQWAALAGNFEITHVHVPHYCDMFQRLFRSPRPHRFGHVFLPEGSKNLGSPEYALQPGTKAPLVGTVMEVLQAVRFADGRLLILAVGVGRFRVVEETQQVPHCRATVELLVDVEEQQQFEGLALQAVESVRGGLDTGGSSDSSSGDGSSGGQEVPLTAVMEVVPCAAREAAGAYSQAWLDYELSEARVEGAEGPAVIDGSRSGDAQVLGRRLAAIAGNEIMELPFFQPLASAAAQAQEGTAVDAAAGSDSSDPGSSSSSSMLQQVADALRPVLRQTDAAAYTLATSAAAACVARHLPQLSDSAAGSDATAAAPFPLKQTAPMLNTASDRGIATEAPEEVLSEECLSSEPDSLKVALRLEAAVWAEISAVHGLASKLRERAAPLPDGLRCLRPWQLPASDSRDTSAAAGTGEEGGLMGDSNKEAASGPGAHPDYPALRRVQRLSYGVTSLLANVSATEGRQAWVEAGSICARLRLGLAALRKHRQVLAAMVAVEGL